MGWNNLPCSMKMSRLVTQYSIADLVVGFSRQADMEHFSS